MILANEMNKPMVILGVILVIAGIGAAAYFGFGTRLRDYGSYGIAIVGVLIAIGGVMMKPGGTTPKGQFKCAKCGMTFSSQAALDQHSKDKHGL